MKLNQEKYIERIKFRGKLGNNINCLKELHRCHLMTIPFEALDVKFKNNIELNLERIFDKVVVRKRGGYCYELNYLFHSLLTKIGFKCYLISCRVYDEFKFGPEYDHMAILVKLEGEEEWLIDVGFGDLFIEPIRIIPEVIQSDQFKDYTITKTDQSNFILSESLKDRIHFLNKYLFSLQSREIDEFKDQNEFKQHSPKSHFVKNAICTLPTESGRKTIKNNNYKLREGNLVKEREITSKEDFMSLLQKEFNIEM